MLPGANDCERQAIARSFRKSVEKRGFKLREIAQGIGASVGQAVHAAIAEALVTRSIAGGIEAGKRVFRDALQGAYQIDEETRNHREGELQIEAMTLEYWFKLGNFMFPNYVEFDMQAVIRDGWILGGKLDVLDEPKLRDTKTGSIMRPYDAQAGGYSILAKANGLSVDSLWIDFIQRVRADKPVPDLLSYEIPTKEAEQAAWHTANRIIDHIELFSKTREPWVFPANNRSLNCKSELCPAFGTDFCDSWQALPPKREKKND